MIRKSLFSVVVLATAVHFTFAAFAPEANAQPSGCQWAPDGSLWCPPTVATQPAAPAPAPTPTTTGITMDTTTVLLLIAVIVAVVLSLLALFRRQGVQHVQHGHAPREHQHELDVRVPVQVDTSPVRLEVRAAPQPPAGGGAAVPVVAFIVGSLIALALSAAPNAAMAQAPAPGLVQVAPPNPRIAALEADLAKAKDDAKAAWDAADKAARSASATVAERRRLNEVLNSANAKVDELEDAIKAAEGKTAAAEAKTAEANAEAAKAKSAFAHCEGLDANAKADCLEQAGESKAAVDQTFANKLLDLNLAVGGLTHDGKAAVGGAAVNGGRVRYRLRDGDTSIKFEASVDPVMTAIPATISSTAAAEQLTPPPTSTGSSWKRYLGACAVGGVGFAGVRGFDYYNSRTPKQVDGDHALSIMGTAAATGCAGGVVAMAIWDAAVYAFSE